MSKYLLLGLLIFGIAIGTYIGCGPRSQVAKNKVIGQIDKVLGELNVKRQTVENSYENAQEAYQKLRDKRLEAEVLKQRFEREIVALEGNQAGIRTNLEKLKPLLEEAQAKGQVEKNGVVRTVEQLKLIADESINELKRNQEQLAHKKKMATISEKNFAVLSANEATSKKQLTQLKDDIASIDSKREMLDSMKTDASLLSGEGTSISDEFDKLSKEVDDLMLKVDTQVAIEEAKLEDRIADIESAPLSVDDLFKDDTDVSGTLSNIDDVLKSDGDK